MAMARATRYSRQISKAVAENVIVLCDNENSDECENVAAFMTNVPATRSIYELTYRENAVDALLFTENKDDITKVKGGLLVERKFQDEPPTQWLIQSSRPDSSTNGKFLNIARINCRVTVWRDNVDLFDENGFWIATGRGIVYKDMLAFYTDQNKPSSQREGGVEVLTVNQLQFSKKYKLEMTDEVVATMDDGTERFLKLESEGGLGLEGIFNWQLSVFKNKEAMVASTMATIVPALVPTVATKAKGGKNGVKIQ